MDGWLARLPSRVLAAYPVLSYARADMAAAANDSGTARRLFDLAAQQFAAASDADGACRSMLAASAAAADAGDLAAARARARAAGSLADEAGLTVLRMWARWQEGRAALAVGDTDDAVALFARAATAPLPEDATDLVRLAGRLATRVEDLRWRRESHREAEAALGHAEHQALEELLASVRVAGRRDDGLPGANGWSRAPPPLKQPGLGEAANSRGTGQAGSWARLRRALLPNRHSGDRCPSQDANGGHSISGPARPELPGAAGPLLSPQHAAADGAVPAAGAAAVLPVAISQPRTRRSAPELAVRLLGPLCVTVNDVPVEDWSSGRCRSLFGYLLTHRQPWPPREVLMEVFWPGSKPAARKWGLASSRLRPGRHGGGSRPTCRKGKHHVCTWLQPDPACAGWAGRIHGRHGHRSGRRTGRHPRR